MATLSPLLDAPVAVQFHAVTAILATAIGPFALFRKRRDRLHKMLGYAWVTMMALTALSSFLIHGFQVIGPFSPIHLLSAWTMISLTIGVRAAIARRFAMHQGHMRALYFWALGVAGLFTLLPGRVMHRVLFDEDTLVGFGLIAIGAVMAWLLGGSGMRLRQSLGFKL